MKRRQNTSFLRPRSSKITLAKEKERRKRKRKEKEWRRREKSSCRILSFYNNYVEGNFWPKKTVGRKRSIWRYRYQKPGEIYIWLDHDWSHKHVMEIAWMILISHNLRSLSLRWDYLHAFKFPWILLVLKKFGPGQKRGMKGRVRGEIGWWGCYSRNVLKTRTLPHHVKVVTPLGDKVFLPVRCILSYLKVWFIMLTIIHSTHYLFSDWPKAYSEFSKSAPGASSSCRLYNNYVKETQGHG